MSNETPEVACLGEALIDLASERAGVGLDGVPGFRKAGGGAPANVAVGVVRLGRRAAFLGTVGTDPFGRFLRDTLRCHGVNVTGVVRLAARRTALALVSLKADGDRDFLFYGERPAHLGLRLTQDMRSIIWRAGIFHYGSISLIADSARLATLAAIREARCAHRLCSYDPNLRLNLWPDARTAQRWMWEGLRHADCVKVNEEELASLTGKRRVAQGLRALVEAGPRLAVVTLGREGCAYSIQRDSRGESPRLHRPGRRYRRGRGCLRRRDARGPSGRLRRRSPHASGSSRFGGDPEFRERRSGFEDRAPGGIPSLPTYRRVARFLRKPRVESRILGR